MSTRVNPAANQNMSPQSRLEARTKYTGDPIDTIVILAVSVVGLVVALAWRDAVSEAFDEYFPETSSRLSAMFAYAIISTIVAVIIILLIAKVR